MDESARPDKAILHLGDLATAWAERQPDAPAILAPGRPPLTYAALVERVARVGADLRAVGVGRRDRVALVLPNGPDAAVALLATACTAVAVPTDPGSTAEEIADWFAAVRPAAVVVAGDADGPVPAAAHRAGAMLVSLESAPGDPAGRFALRRLAGPTIPSAADGPPAPGDVALLLATSGTTGRPRRVPLTHANLCAGAFAKAAAFGLSPADRCLALTSAFHVYHASHLLMTLASGGSIVCPPTADAEGALRWLEEFRPTRLTAVPAMLRAIVERAAGQAVPTGDRLRIVHSGAASLPPPLLAEIETTLGAPVLEGYGLTETAAVLTGNPPPPAPRKAGSVGLATGCDVAVIDDANRRLPAGAVGEVVVRGPSVTAGYDGDPDATAAAFTPDGWFRTGDLGYLDADGYLFLTGRLKEQINRGGTKIAPAEVEAVLLDHPAVAAAAVFAVPDDRLGEGVGAAVVPRDGRAIDRRELRAFATARLSAHKVPRRIAVVDRLPTTRTGKPLRVGLADRLGLGAPLGLGASLAPAPTSANPGEAAGFAPPRTATEAAVAGVWRLLLETDRVGADDDFFDLGGHSLLVAKLAAHLRDAIGVDLSPAAIFEAPTVAEQAARIDAARRDAASSAAAPAAERALVTLRDGDGVPVFVVPGGRGAEENLFRFAQVARHVGSDRPFLGFFAGETDETADPDRWLTETAAAYLREARARQPHGPYLLLGVCVGGVLALEMGRLLHEAGEGPPHVVLVDTLLPTPELAAAVAAPRRVRRRSEDPAPERRPGTEPRPPRVRLLMRCTPRPYLGRITLFANQAWRRDDPTLGWAPFAAGGVEVRPLPGRHGDLRRDDPGVLAAALAPLLEEPVPAAVS